MLPGEEEPAAGPSVAARVTATLLRKLPVPKKMQSIRLGVAYTNGELPEGLNSLKGESVFGKKYFDNVYVKGRRQRIGTEFEWTPGPIGVKAEWMQAREDRRQQGNRNEDLSDFLSTGWYTSGTWLRDGREEGRQHQPPQAAVSRRRRGDRSGRALRRARVQQREPGGTGVHQSAGRPPGPQQPTRSGRSASTGFPTAG